MLARGRWREATALLGRMEQLGVDPNAHSYCAAIAAHEQSARWRDALGLLAAMKARLVQARDSGEGAGGGEGGGVRVRVRVREFNPI